MQQQPSRSSIWRKTQMQDSFVRLDDGDEERDIGIARTTETMPDSEKTAVVPIAQEVERCSPESEYMNASDESSYSSFNSNSTTTETTTTKSQSPLYWPTSRSWCEKIDEIGGSVLGSDNELSDIGSPISSVRSN